jgi:hypothetical protein
MNGKWKMENGKWNGTWPFSICHLPFAILLMLSGCHTVTVDQPVARTLGGSDPDAQLEFWHRLGEQHVTSNDDAFHGLLLYLDDEDASPDYVARVAALRSRHLLPSGFHGSANEAVTRGTLAVAIARILNIKGGILMHLTGGHERYAVRELMYLNLFPPSTPNQTFSGAEFLGIIGRIEDYQRGNPAEAPAKVLPVANVGREESR